MAYIGAVNASTFFIETDNESLIQSLYEEMRYKEPEFQQNQFSKWDGKKRLFNRKNGTFPSGMLSMVLSYCKLYEEKADIQECIKEIIRPIERKDIQEWVDNLDIRSGGNKITPYDYQVEGLYNSIKYSRYLALAATSAGKTLLQYLCCRFWQEMMGEEGKILIVVPTLQLVNQTYADFGDYSSHDSNWSVDMNCHKAGDGVSPYSRKQIIICTWQTLGKQEREYFYGFNFLMGDEAHTFGSDTLDNIANNCINCWQRLGLTATLRRNSEDHRMKVAKHFGDSLRLISTKELQDRGLATKTVVNMIGLEYPTEVRRKWRNNPNYRDEMDFLIEYEPRNDVIVRLASRLKGNSLFLFNNIEHIEIISAKLTEKGVYHFVIHGDIKVEERDDIKAIIERGDDIVLLATYGTTSTGISIKKLHNLVYAHPRKTNISIQQSIGRLLRLHDSKDIAYIYDIFDIMQFSGKKNKSMEFAGERLSIYVEEGHPINSIMMQI
ncbi:hypothetical protein SHAb15599_00087 [Acinetobacter phage SH-Ab 15599]|nr:hypothetical protein SHAb15599_00087 [Acinetobacter phage SH-Ab 15599]